MAFSSLRDHHSARARTPDCNRPLPWKRLTSGGLLRACPPRQLKRHENELHCSYPSSDCSLSGGANRLPCIDDSGGNQILRVEAGVQWVALYCAFDLAVLRDIFFQCCASHIEVDRSYIPITSTIRKSQFILGIILLQYNASCN